MGKPVRKRMALRQMAVIIAIAAAVTHLPRTKVWNATEGGEDWNAASATVKMRKDKFIKYWFDRFMEEGTLLDHKVTRTPKGITAEEALYAAVWLKTGYWIQVQGRGTHHTRWVHRWYPSVRKACQKCPELKALRDNYGYTNKQLLFHMRLHDPALRYRRVYCKVWF